MPTEKNAHGGGAVSSPTGGYSSLYSFASIKAAMITFVSKRASTSRLVPTTLLIFGTKAITKMMLRIIDIKVMITDSVKNWPIKPVRWLPLLSLIQLP